ncbi:MAG: hypothetical protein IJI65_01295 [Lachnospiraceae bacterium]|nr:hypothetical protein [Lachnospiraceae bacterium]
MNKLGTKLGAIAMSAVMALTFAPSAAITSLAAGGDDLTDATQLSVPVYRLYNPNSGEHLFTTSENECDSLDKNGWDFETIAWYAPTVGDQVYRLYNPNHPLGDHHYTASEEERDNLIKQGWRLDATAFNTVAEGDVPLGAPIYSLYNPNAYDLGMATHHLTLSKEEADGLALLGWTNEGAKFYEYAEDLDPVVEELTVSINNTTPKVGDTLTAVVEPDDAVVTYQWCVDGVALLGADDDTLEITEDMIGSVISVIVTDAEGNTAESEDTKAVISSDEDAPEIVDASVADAWTLEVEFDEDIIKGEDYALAVTLGSTEIDVDEKINGSTMTITKADGSSFAAGTYTISVTGVEDKYGNASEELTAEVTKDNSFAAGFEAYEGYVSEYDIDHDGAAGGARKIHLTVTDQYGESMNKALSSTYGTIATKAYIKSNNSIIASTFNKTGEQIDGVDMAYVTLLADKDFKAGETVVIAISNTISGVTYDSEVEVEILEYDLVQTAQVVTNMEQTTDKDTINKNWVQGDDEGSLSLTADNDVFLITTALDSNGNNATKGNIKYVTSDPSVVKVSSAFGGATQYKETALASRDYDLDGTLGAGTDDDVFGIWLRGLKAGTATITAYATGNIEAAYTFKVTIEGAEMSVGAPIGFIGKRVYFPVENTDGITQGDLAGVVSTLETEDSDGNRVNVANSIALTPYTATSSTADKKLGLEDGKYYLYSDAFKNHSVQSAYVANVSATAGNFAKSEEVEYYLYPEVTVDSDVTAGSGIYFGAQNTLAATAAAVYPTKAAVVTAANGVTDIGQAANAATIGAGAAYGANNTNLTDKTGGVKGTTYYKAINVINVAPIRIARFAASQIKYAWSDDTVGSAKVDIIDSIEGAAALNALLENAGTVLLAVTPKSDQVIGTLTISVGGASEDIDVELGNNAAAGAITVTSKDDGKVALINAATNAAFEDGTPASHTLTIKLEDQYGDTNVAGNKALQAVAAGTTGLRLKNATEASNALAAKVITGELTATLVDNNDGTYTVTLSAMSEGAHTLTFYVGKSCTEIGENDPQYTVEVEFVQKKDITSVEIQSEVEYAYDNALIGKFADATSDKASDSVKGVNINIGTAAKNTVIQPKAKAYVGDKEVSGAQFTWTLLDKSIGFTETWNAAADGSTPAGSKSLTIKNGAATEAFTCDEGAEAVHTGAITVDSDGNTNLSVLATNDAVNTYKDTNGDLTGTTTRNTILKGGSWTENNEGVSGVSLNNLLKVIKLAKAGDAAEVSGTFHLNATVAGTDKEDEAYIHVSNKGLKISVDDMYLAYGADNEKIGVSENEAVGEAIKVKAGDATGTRLRICAVDTAFGGILYDETAATYSADNAGDGTLIVGTDAAAVIAAGDTVVNNDTITIKAAAGTAGKSASLRLPVTTGGKTRYITVPLEIVK